MAILYVHIPFCEKKCLYCDFYSVEQKSLIPRFLTSLEREASMRREAWASRSFDTVYLGGGTPSLLDLDLLSRLLTFLAQSFSMAERLELTLEVNPGTVDRGKLHGLRNIGVNRLSIGVQSFDDAELRFLGRIHSADQARECVRMARDAGFSNLSLDLVYAIPGQTAQSWMSTLETALSHEPEHLSAYSLIVEEHTPLERMVRSGQIVPAGEGVEADLYERTMMRLESAGFDHYEVSNYARPGYRSRHNYGYWSHVDCLGLGPSAHSFVMEERYRRARRFRNLVTLTGYCSALEGGNFPVDWQEELSARELANERILLGLRADGLDLKALEEDCGVDLVGLRRPVIAGLLEQGLGTMKGEVMRLTPKGYLLCDEVVRRLLLP